ncbi:winged helix DNA-binding domain-containing protein [Rhodococcus chondri]|uniref:Winged helix DNA-binding domain-containing protein n=1 Tax=Rhodococcus chondri TaxID=3065941 RepID=A0ABU7JLL5_9NOCA|nr:winged helix DNA-binding domain-containing protein [Rhodococcus sp. CC-R104]MEE2030933.1 winged helix DNA-binding domain-containing protein [Rhodococcus sp. CC-R104]
MVLRKIDATERRARLGMRHSLAAGHHAQDAVEAATRMVCLHGTDPATVYLSVWARIDDFTVADLDKALYVDRSLVKHLAMRRTVFVFPRHVLPFAQAGASNRVAAVQRRSVAKDVAIAGLHTDGEQWLNEASAHVLQALSDGREATSSELRAEIPLIDGAIEYGTGKSWGGKVSFAPRVLTVLSASGQVVRASNNGPWRISRPRWATTESWLGSEIEPCSEDEGLRTLVELWLRAFGPGTETDIKWWLGSTLKAVRAALAELGAVEVDLDGRTGYVLPDDVDEPAPVEPWGALLPALDPTTMGWFERDWYLGPYKEKLFDTNGNAGPTAWWDGKIVGTWWQNDDGAVSLHVLEDIGAEGVAFLESEPVPRTGTRKLGAVNGSSLPPYRA